MQRVNSFAASFTEKKKIHEEIGWHLSQWKPFQLRFKIRLMHILSMRIVRQLKCFSFMFTSNETSYVLVLNQYTFVWKIFFNRCLFFPVFFFFYFFSLSSIGKKKQAYHKTHSFNMIETQRLMIESSKRIQRKKKQILFNSDA